MQIDFYKSRAYIRDLAHHLLRYTTAQQIFVTTLEVEEPGVVTRAGGIPEQFPAPLLHAVLK